MKNNLTLLAREGKAKASQNTGGGASQQSTAQHDSARVFNYFNTQMARFLWNKKGEATVSKSSCSWAQGRATSAEQPTNHALITHLSPTQTVSLARIWKYVACLLLVLFMGVGNVWAGTITWSFANPGSKVDLSQNNPHQFTGNDSSTKLYYTGASGDELAASGTYIKINGASSNSSNVYNSRYFTFTAPSSAGTLTFECAGTAGTTLISTGTNGTVILATVTNSANNSVTSAKLEGLTAGSTTIYIQNVSKSYFKSITWTDAEAPSYTSAYYSLVKTSMTGATLTASSATQQNGGSNLYADFANYYKTGNSTGYVNISFANPNTPIALNSNGSDCGRIKIYYGHTGAGNGFSLDVNSSTNVASYTTAIANRIYVAEYTIPDGTSSISSLKMTGSGSSGLYICAIDILTYSSGGGGGGGADPEPSCTTPTIAWSEGSADNISAINGLAATNLGIDVTEYTGNITWTLTGDDIVTLSNESKTGCTITGKTDAYGTATLTASFTLSGDASLCDGTYSVTKTITIIACNEPSLYTNEIARFFVPCGLSNAMNKSVWAVENEDASTGANKFTTSAFGGTGSNWATNTTTGLSYGKLTGDGSYISLKLNSGNFKAGDVVTAYVNSNSEALQMNSGTAKAFSGKIASGVTGEYKCSITLAADNVESDGSIKIKRTSSIYVNRIIVTREPPCVGDPGDISKGTLSAGVLTLNAAGTPLSGDTWYWQSSSTGTDQTNSGTSYGVSAAGTYYVRSYNATGTCWSDAKSFTVTAEDLVENFTVVYKDGETTLGSETVEVGEHPSAAGISTTKEFYTFAAWQESGVDKALNTVSAANGETVTLTARYTAQYTSGTYEFTGHLTMGTSPQMTINNSSDGQNYNAGRIDNIYVSAQKIGYEASGDYGGWKLKTTDGTLRFMVENVCGIRVTLGEANPLRIAYTESGVAKSADIAKSTTSTIYKADANSLVTLTNFTANNKTVTLKKIEILPLYNVTYTDDTGDASGSASNVAEVTLPSPTETVVTVETVDYSFTGWKANQAVTVNDVVKSAGTLLNAGDVAVLGANTTFTAQWAVVVPKYTITKGSHTNGDFTIAPTSQEAGETVTLSATPNEDYVFSAWAVVKTEDGSATGITVSNNTFTMPAYGVTVNATFAADPRSKVLYVTSNTADATKSDDKVYAALKDTYNVKIVGPTSDADQSGYALVVLHESLNGGNDYNATAVAAAKTGTTPVLNTKAYFYNSGRWAWGTPNAGKKTKGVHVNRTYCNITNHPLFNDLTPDANDSIIILSSISGDNKPIQPIGSFTSGKEGYTLANVPDGCAIHELTPAQRGAVSGKYLLISLYTKDFANLNANGQKLFQNAAAYLIGNTAWEPINALTSPAVAASPSAAYTVGNNIALTASATGVSAATTYTWYKGATWAAAEEAGAIKATATAAAGGNTYGITGCALGDAGTYWCVISNGTGCDAKASLEITVSDIAYDITFVSAHGTAPTATTGVSYTLPELTASGWEHQGWTASIDVTVDAATVTAGTTIDNGKIATFAADVTFTAVWTQVFDVTFNMQSHGAAVAEQHILDGGKVTEPNDPAAIGWVFGGWYKEAGCENAWDFDNDVVTEDTELFAKWTAFAGCTEVWPATSGDALTVGATVDLQSGSTGAIIKVAGMNNTSSIVYNGTGLYLSGGGKDSVRVELNNLIAKDTKITLIMVAGGTSERGLNIQTLGKSTVYQAKWTPSASGELKTIEYTVPENSPLIGQSAFLLQRNNTVYLKAIKVSACGAALLNLSSAVSVADKGTVTLSATRVASGATATATYSAINAAYEFDEWQISGTGATLSSTTANPVTITMGSTDATITLKLKAATPKHTVTFNKMGKGDDIDDQEVKEGDLVEEPTVIEPEGWILEGWYTENTFETKWDFANDVMSTSDIELFANWVADPSIKLLSGSTVNHTDFITGVSVETVEISSVNYDCVKFSGTVSNVNGVKDLTRVIAYNAKTNKTKIQLHLYNTSTSNRTVLVKGVLEGNTSTDDIVDLASITLGNKEQKETEYIEFNNAANRTIYIFIGSSAGDVRFLQVKVIDDGATPMKAAGQAGYSLNLNKGRFFGPASTDLAFEGLNVRLSGEYTAMNSGYAKLASTSMSFTVASAMTLNVTANNNKTYYVTKGSAGTDNETAKAGVSEFDLTAGTWYITAGSNEVQFTNIAFIAPKCAEPAFNALANSELCEGDEFVALDGTATVADAGTPIYQWYNADGDAEIDGATSATYTPTADGSYYVIATNQLSGYTDNEKKSATVTVTHYAAAAITTAPVDVRKDVGDEATLSVVATGKAPLTYQWYTCDDETGANPVIIAGAEASSYSVTITAGLDQYYKVVVTSGCGSAEAVAKIVEWKELPQLKVSTTTTWDWENAASADIKLSGSTTPKKNEECLMANIKVSGNMPTNDETFNSQALLFSGENVRTSAGGRYYASGGHVKFTTTVPGKVTVEFSTNTDDKIRCVKINGVASETSDKKATVKTFSSVVPAGEVAIVGYEGETEDAYVRISKIIFSTTDVEGANYTRDLTQGYYGTICLPNGGIMVGATLFELTYFDSSKKKIFCDEIVSGEMVAGTPYIFLPLEGASQLGVYYTDAAGADAGNAHGLFGSYDQELITPNDGNYILYNNQYCFVNSTAYVGANRAYIKLYGDGAATRVENPAAAPKPKQGRRRVAMSAYGEQVATGMDGVQGEGVPYQKVMIDGQLYIMRDGRIYNATGIMVK